MVDRSSPRFLEVSHVAHRLSVSPEYVLRLIRARKLPAIRLGTRYRIDPHDLDAFIDARKLTDDDEEHRVAPPRLHALPRAGGA